MLSLEGTRHGPGTRQATSPGIRVSGYLVNPWNHHRLQGSHPCTPPSSRALVSSAPGASASRLSSLYFASLQGTGQSSPWDHWPKAPIPVLRLPPGHWSVQPLEHRPQGSHPCTWPSSRDSSTGVASTPKYMDLVISPRSAQKYLAT